MYWVMPLAGMEPGLPQCGEQAGPGIGLCVAGV